MQINFIIYILNKFPNLITIHTGNGKFQKYILLLFAVCVSIVFIEGVNMGMVLPTAKCDLNITSGQQGFINSIGFLGIVSASHFWGFLADTWGRKNVLQLSLFLTFCSAAMSSLAYTSWILLFTRFVVGFWLVKFFQLFQLDFYLSNY